MRWCVATTLVSYISKYFWCVFIVKFFSAAQVTENSVPYQKFSKASAKADGMQGQVGHSPPCEDHVIILFDFGDIDKY